MKAEDGVCGEKAGGRRCVGQAGGAGVLQAYKKVAVVGEGSGVVLGVGMGQAGAVVAARQNQLEAKRAMP